MVSKEELEQVLNSVKSVQEMLNRIVPILVELIAEQESNDDANQ